MFFHSLSSPLSDGFDRVHRRKRSQQQQQQQRFHPPAEPPITCCCRCCCWRHLRALSSSGSSGNSSSNRFVPSPVFKSFGPSRKLSETRQEVTSECCFLIVPSPFDLHHMIPCCSGCGACLLQLLLLLLHQLLLLHLLLFLCLSPLVSFLWCFIS